MEVLNQLKDTLWPALIDYGLDVVWGIVILILGWAASKWFAHQAEKYFERSKRVRKTIAPVLVKCVRGLVIAIVLLMVLGQLGIETASVIALLGTVGLAIGLALQGSLSNVASGLMILVLRPFEVGDAVNIGGRDAVIDEIGLFVTEMHTFNNIALIITNTQVWQDFIQNYTRNETRRVDMIFSISYENKIEDVVEIIKKVLNEDERVLSEPEALVGVGGTTGSLVDIFVRPWAKTDEQFGLKLDLQKQIMKRFEEEEIKIPYPQPGVLGNK